MRAQGHHPTAITLLLTCLLSLALGCKSDAEKAQDLVEAAWGARLTGDANAFAELVRPEDREFVGPSGVVPNMAAVSRAEQVRMRKTFEIESTAKGADPIVVSSTIRWYPPGSPELVEESHDYLVAKTDTGLALDFELEKRAKVARSLMDAREAIRAGKPEEATRALAAVDADDLPQTERAMMTDALEATKDSVESAGTLAELREIMEAHHQAEDPGERATLVARARKLNIEELQLPPDIQTLWDEAKKGAESAETLAVLGEKIQIDATAEKVGHGATIRLDVSNFNGKAVSAMKFSIDLIDADGVRLHRITHEWQGPIPAGESGSTTAEAPAVPGPWEGAVNVRLESIAFAGLE